jgi:FKBP-type peptidyl-prolyl cis-trans isomerase
MKSKTVLGDLQNQVRERQEEKRLALVETNKKEGDAFLAANKTKEGVVTLPSGLQYKVLVAGTGAKPSAAEPQVPPLRSPGFPVEVGGAGNFMRLSLRKAAHAALAGAAQ